MIEVYNDAYFMKEALKEAAKAKDENEVPVGAVIVSKKKIIARGYNQIEKLHDVTAHAEIIALTSACNYLGAKYLDECTIYVTLEPCPMCAGALAHAHVGKVVFGAEDEKSGFMRFGKKMLHPKTKVEFGIMNKECREILTQFFEEKRSTQV